MAEKTKEQKSKISGEKPKNKPKPSRTKGREKKELHPNFGKNLKEIRKTYGVSRQELANYLGMESEHAVHVIGSWERGIREPSLLNVHKISDFFGISIDRLLGKENEGSKFIKSVNDILLAHEKDMLPEDKKRLLAIVAALSS